MLLGQRFVFDSLVFSETTYERIPAYRMMPSPLDVAAAVFKNPAAEALLAIQSGVLGDVHLSAAGRGLP